jgi:hypothetical protein
MAIKFVKQLFFATNSLVTKFTNYFNRNHKVLQQKTLVCNNKFITNNKFFTTINL